MLKDNPQLKLSLSPYQGIYDAIIPADHLLRKICPMEPSLAAPRQTWHINLFWIWDRKQK